MAKSVYALHLENNKQRTLSRDKQRESAAYSGKEQLSCHAQRCSTLRPSRALKHYS